MKLMAKVAYMALPAALLLSLTAVALPTHLMSVGSFTEVFAGSFAWASASHSTMTPAADVKFNDKKLQSRVLTAESLDGLGRHEEALKLLKKVYKKVESGKRKALSRNATESAGNGQPNANRPSDRGGESSEAEAYVIRSMVGLYKKLRMWPKAQALVERHYSLWSEDEADEELAPIVFEQGKYAETRVILQHVIPKFGDPSSIKCDMTASRFERLSKMYATAMEKTPFLSKLDMSVVEQERRERIAKASAQ